MKKSNFLTLIIKLLTRFIGGIIFFPVWWYSFGFIRMITKMFNFWQEEQKALGFTIWLKNIFVPMYGQRDFSGRLISFFIRLFQIIFRGLVLLFWALVCLTLLLLWLSLPALLLIAMAYQLI
jgi:hypothetical protein